MRSANLRNKRLHTRKVRSLVALGVAFLLGTASCSDTGPAPATTTGTARAAATTTSTQAATASTEAATTSTEAATTTTTATPPPTTLPPQRDVITLTEDEVQGDVVAAVDLDGHLVVSYFAPGHDAIRLLRCVDTACAEPPSIVFLDFLGYSEPIDMALRPDGRAIVIAQSADFLSATVYECDDAECNLAGLDEFVDEAACEWDDGRPCSRADFVQMAIAPDGLPRIAYYHGNPPTLKLAVCGDPTCLAENRTTVVIDDDLTGYGRPALRISPAGRVLIGYGTGDGETSEARVAVCEDAACSTGPTIHKFSDASMARTTWGAGDEFLVWYRTGPEGPSGPIDFDDIWGSWSGFADIMMAECSPDGCAEPVRIEAGEDWLIPWMAGIDILETANSGTVAVFNHIAQNDSDLRLRLTRCADQTCTSAVTEKLGVDAVFGWSFDAVVHDGSLWIVFAEEAGGLHLAEVPLDV